MQRTLLEGYIDRNRGRARPRMSWYDNIKKWTGMQYEQAIRMAVDRGRWRAACVIQLQKRNMKKKIKKSITKFRFALRA